MYELGSALQFMPKHCSFSLILYQECGAKPVLGWVAWMADAEPSTVEFGGFLYEFDDHDRVWVLDYGEPNGRVAVRPRIESTGGQSSRPNSDVEFRASWSFIRVVVYGLHLGHWKQCAVYDASSWSAVKLVWNAFNDKPYERLSWCCEHFTWDSYNGFQPADKKDSLPGI